MLEASGEKKTDHIKYRNMWVQVLLFIITIGVYGIYWFFVTYRECSLGNGKEDNQGCFWTIISVIPIANLFAQWRYSMEYAEFVREKYPGIAIFILWIVFSPVVWFLVQMDLNRAARTKRL